MLLSRRTIIASGAATAGASVLHFVSATSASAEPPPKPVAAVSSGRSLFAQFYSTDWANHLELQYPVILEVADSSGAGPGFQATLSFDARLFDPSPAVLLYQGSSVRSAPTIVSTAGDGSSLLSFGLDRGLGSVADDLAVHFSVPLFPRALYPFENLGTVAPVVFSLQANNSVTASTLSWHPSVAVTGVSPWGVEVSAGWQDFVVSQGKKDSRYRAPMTIRLDSVGPTPIPAGTTIDIDVDARILAALEITGASLDRESIAVSTLTARSEVTGDALRTRLTLNRPVAAGSTLEILTEPRPRAGKIRVTSIRYGSVTVAAPVNALSPQRDTLRYNIVDLTRSGSPLAENIARGTI